MALTRNPTLSQVNADVRSAEGTEATSRPLPQSHRRILRRRNSRRLLQLRQARRIRQPDNRAGRQARRSKTNRRAAAPANSDQCRSAALQSPQQCSQRLLRTPRSAETGAGPAPTPLTRTGRVQTSHQLGNVGQADQPDILQAEVESEQAALALDSAKKAYQSLWETLAATVGNPDLPIGRVEGNLEDLPQLNQQEWLAKMLSDSPQVKLAQQEVEHEKAALSEAKKSINPRPRNQCQRSAGQRTTRLIAQPQSRHRKRSSGRRSASNLQSQSGQHRNSKGRPRTKSGRGAAPSTRSKTSAQRTIP